MSLSFFFLVEEYRQTKTWLRHHADEWNLVKEKWAATSRLRLWEASKVENLTSANIVELFPTLCHAEGYQLIQLDFGARFNTKQKLLFDRWNNFCERVRSVYEADVTDRAGKCLVELLRDDDITEGINDCFLPGPQPI